MRSYHKGYVLKAIIIAVAICFSNGLRATSLPSVSRTTTSVTSTNYQALFGLTGLTAPQLSKLNLPGIISLPTAFQIYTAPAAGGYTQSTTLDISNNSAANYANIIEDSLDVTGGNLSFNNNSTGSVVNTITGGLNASTTGQVQFFGSSNIIAGIAATNNTTIFLDNSTNFVTNDITADNSVVRLNSSTNIITGNITASNGSTILLGSSTNTITGNIIADGGSVTDSSVSLSGTNNITGNITASNNGIVSLNAGGASTTNNITGGITCDSGGTVYLSDSNGNGSTTTVDTVIINNGGIFQTGQQGSTTINTLNWNDGGNFTVVINSSQATPVSPIDITTLNVTGIPVLSIYDINQGSNITSYSTTLNLMTVGNVVSGSLTQVQLSNGMPLQEITNVSYGANNFTITLQPAATTSNSAAPGFNSDAAFAAQAIVAGVSGATTTDPDAFKSIANTYADTFKKFRLNGGKWFAEPEILFKQLASENQQPLILPARAGSKVWFSPYYAEIQNSGTLAQNGFNEQIYGALVGVDHKFASIKAAFGVLFGYGSSLMKMQRSINSHTKGQQLTTGLYMNKQFMDGGLWMSLVNFIKANNQQQRRGDPTPTSSYLATSKYKTESFTFTNDLSYVFKFNGGFSLKPNVGLFLMQTKRFQFSENAPAPYAQTYKNKIIKQGELYGGLGLRQKWLMGEKTLNKLTFVYELGKENGSGLQNDVVYTQGNPNGVGILTPSAGSTTQYFSLYCSTANIETGLKFTLGGTVTVQRSQKSYMASLKMDIKL